jgi:hypothetical protein
MKLTSVKAKISNVLYYLVEWPQGQDRPTEIIGVFDSGDLDQVLEQYPGDQYSYVDLLEIRNDYSYLDPAKAKPLKLKKKRRASVEEYQQRILKAAENTGWLRYDDSSINFLVSDSEQALTSLVKSGQIKRAKFKSRKFDNAPVIDGYRRTDIPLHLGS